MIDSHCHLHYDPYDEDRDEVIQRAILAGVTQFILPGTDSVTHENMFDLVKRYPNICFATLGVHPTVINEAQNSYDEVKVIEKYLQNPPVRIVAIGEIGLDYYWSQDFKEQQKKAFVAQLDLARKHKLPIIIHTRQAWDDTLDTLENYRDLEGVFHCFSCDENQWQRVKTFEKMRIGLNATVSYKKYAAIDILPKIPLERIILETDGPYLAPAPYRGKRNEPAYIPLFAGQIAGIFGKSVEEFDKIATFNTRSLFKI